MDKIKLFLGALLAVVLGLFSLERLKRKNAETLLENAETKKKDEAIKNAADKFMNENAGLMSDLAALEQEEKTREAQNAGAKTKEEILDYWNKKK